MTYELKQSLKLSQQLIMTPQLQQAIKLLQLSRIELVDMIQQEMEENPLLEERATEEFGEDGAPAPEVDEVKAVEHTGEVTGEGDGKEDFDWDNYLEDYGPMRVTYDREEDEGPSWENMLSRKTTLTDHLMWQLGLSRLTEAERKVGEQIIGNLDSSGYLVATIDEIAEQEKTGIDVVEKVLAKIQEFDPPGIASRDLKECLMIQAKILGAQNSLVEIIVRDYLHDLETKNYNNIAKKLKVPLAEVLDAIFLISRMDPKPGLVYSDEGPQYIIPDVFVFKVSEEYKIILNDEGLPRLRISNFYREILGGTSESATKAEECKKYIKERLQSATWLIKSIQQRQRTIYRVTESIVKFQREFFDKGINFLKPLVLRDVADDVEMHESTISRVTTNKYMHTPRGIYELKYFFNSSISKTSGDAIASKSVQEEIRKIISGEDARKPLSDSEIVDILSGQGISIARRTVAKYREMMGILPSSKRKKFFIKPKN
jgi:RNA polymerase sigma-54 factor